MQMVEVTGKSFRAVCIQCRKAMDTGNERVWADPDGPAFRAYYCDECKTESKEGDHE